MGPYNIRMCQYKHGIEAYSLVQGSSLFDNFQERDSAVEMWHLALREVDNLEEALRSYHDNRHMDLAQKKNEDVCWISVTNFVT